VSGSTRKPAEARNLGDWKAESSLLRVIAHPVRLRLLSLLCEHSYCVKDLNALVPRLPQPHLSHHMGALRRVGVVASHKDGALRCYYILRPSLVLHLIDLLRATHPERHRDKSDVQREARARTRALVTSPSKRKER
jgi:ArsR family transcriptional regulator